MKLYIKQKVFSFRDRFTVRDEFGRDVYSVSGELISLGKRLHILDNSGREAALVKQKLLTFLPKFTISISGMGDVEIVRKLTLFKPYYIVSGIDWEVNGSFTEHNYSITRSGRAVAKISKAWFSWGDSYEINVSDPEDALMALAVVIAIDAVLANDDAAVSASN
ncbi:MAG: LURP-one-related family protein [Ruminococcus sp.]|nr:LURP-one-related family protein [Ruminococcus sp.]